MGLKHSYTLLAPLYDTVVERASQEARRRSLERLRPGLQRVLLPGVGSGLDIPWLPRGSHYAALDLTPAMLERAGRRAREAGLDMELEVGDAGQLPYRDHSFDGVVLHLILAVVPHPHQVLRETARVLRPGGQVLVLDKFLRPGQKAPLRRLVSPLLGRIATRTDVVLEELLSHTPSLRVVDDRPALARGWFRQVELEKEA